MAPIHHCPVVFDDLSFACFRGDIPRDSGRCYAAFPVVGLLIGLMTSLMVLALQAVMPPLLLAAWACAFMTLITRGFHLDGLADLADGLGGGYTPARRLEIMKDSATGAFGSLALVLAILLKASAIYSLIIAKSWLALRLFRPWPFRNRSERL